VSFKTIFFGLLNKRFKLEEIHLSQYMWASTNIYHIQKKIANYFLIPTHKHHIWTIKSED